MYDLEKAKEIYADIISAIEQIEKDYNIYCAIPAFIELNGVIYQQYHCLSKDKFMSSSKRVAKQMTEVMEGKIKLYFNENKND